MRCASARIRTNSSCITTCSICEPLHGRLAFEAPFLLQQGQGRNAPCSLFVLILARDMLFNRRERYQTDTVKIADHCLGYFCVHRRLVCVPDHQPPRDKGICRPALLLDRDIEPGTLGRIIFAGAIAGRLLSEQPDATSVNLRRSDSST
jgi:hypothetical protein